MALALVLMGWCGPVRAESFEAGLRAFRAGEPDRARDIWLPLAEAGDAAAQYSLGKLFEHGEGPVRRDLVKAVQWYRTAAAQGLPAAQNNLGLMYAQGRGVPTDLTRAIEIWRAAAQQNYPWAQYNLGLAFFRGQGVAVDQREAAIWFRQAADGGLAEAQFIMGQLRREGLGLEKDEGRALTWYRRAAEQGHPRARKHAELLRAAGIEPTLPGSPRTSAHDATAGEEVRASAKSPKGGSAAELPRVATKTVVPESDKDKAVPKPRAKPKPQAEAVPKTEMEVEAAAEPQISKAETKTLPKTETKAEAKPEVVAEPSVAKKALAPPQDVAKPEAPSVSEPVSTQTAATHRGGEGMAEAKAKGTFRIWLASARNKATASKLWQTVRERHPEVFAGTEVTFAEVDLGDRTLIRVLVGPLASFQSAEDLCDRLRGVEPDAFCKVRPD